MRSRAEKGGAVMKVHIMPTVMGILALKDKEAHGYEPWDDANEAVEGIMTLEEGKVPPKLVSLVKKLMSEGVDVFVLEDVDVARELRGAVKGIEVEVSPGDVVFRMARENLISYLSKLGVSEETYRNRLYEVSLLLTRRKVKKAAEKRDLFVAQAISAIDDINKTLNLFASRLREWYSLHFPELNDLVDDHEDYVRIVSELKSRDNITKENLIKLGFNEDEAEKIAKVARSSMGADFGDFDFEAIRALASTTLRLYEDKRKLERYIDEAMKEVAPNIRGLVGPLLGARLIALAGGLRKLAMLPASTIQVLGAEKALFRALRTGTKPPKHGVIFQYPAIHRSPRWQRGKIARALAAKLAIAARIDAFTGEYKADMLKEELEARIKEIKTLYAKPPPRKREERPRRPRKKRRRRR